MGMMGGKMDAKNKVIQELMQYLNSKDDMELGDAVMPKGLGVEVTKIQGLNGDEPDGDESPGATPDGDADDMGSAMGGEKMSPEEMDELIEAIQSKIGS